MIPKGPELEVLLGLDGTFRRVPLASISAATRVPIAMLRESLSRLLLSFLDPNDESFTSPGREPTEGGDGSDRSLPVPTETEPYRTVPEEQKTEPYGTEPKGAGARETTGATVAETRALTAEELAEALDDDANLALHRTLVATVDHVTLRTALRETLARRDRLRGRPGAYFTAVLRRLTHPHAHV